MTYKHFSFNDISAELSSFTSSEQGNEHHLMIHINNPQLTYNNQLTDLLESYQSILKHELAGATPVFQRFFLSDIANQKEMLEDVLCHDHKCATSIVEQPLLDGTKIALWVYLMTDVKCRKLNNGLFEVKQGDYTHLWLAAACNRASNAEYQMRLIFSEYIMQLMEQNCTLAANCMRTWIFVQDIDNNYHGVVKARNEVFVTQNLTPETHYISSTGIQGRGSDPKIKVLFDAYAVAGVKPEQIKFLYGRTHLNPTYEYGVSFERGTVIEYHDRKHILISGTASINNKGEIEHPGDIRKQVERLWENVEVLLAEAGADFADMGQFIVYLRDIADYAVVREMYDQRFPDTPKVFTLAPVCRPGWLVEMECMGVKSITNN